MDSMDGNYTTMPKPVHYILKTYDDRGSICNYKDSGLDDP